MFGSAEVQLERLTSNIFDVYNNETKSVEWDVQIHCAGGKKVKCNKQILALGSPLLRNAMSNECRCPIFSHIICPDIKAEILQTVVDMIHSGQIPHVCFSKSDIDEIKSILETFQFSALSIEEQELESDTNPIQSMDTKDLSIGPQAHEECGKSKIKVEITPENWSAIQFHSPPSCVDFKPHLSSYVEIEDPNLDLEDPGIATEEENDKGSVSIDDPFEIAVESPPQPDYSIVESTSKGPDITLSVIEIGHYLCPFCNTTFSLKENLISHMTEMHERKKPFKCTMCGRGFAFHVELKNHILIVHEEKRPFKCSLCDRDFTNKDHLSKHMQEVHLRSKLHKCRVCNRHFVSEHELIKHIAGHHKMIKAFKCSFCGEEFSKNLQLQSHVSITHEIKCTFCNEQFRSDNELRSHVTMWHEKMKPFKCTICARDFTSRAHLRTHILTVHEKRKPYQCKFCNKLFGQNSNLKTHLMRVHQQQQVRRQ